MNLKLIREPSAAGRTFGRLYIDGVVECFTIEDVERPNGPKVHGQTAIPRGTYKVIVNYSNRFKRDLPLLLNVPNFEGIRIHPGNGPENTEGCILPGVGRTDSLITQSRVAFDILFDKMQDAIAGGEDVSIEVTGT